MVTFANLTSGSARNDSTTYVTASVSPAANRLVLLAISTFETSATQPTTPSVTGCGLTWVQVGSFDHDTAGGDRSTCFVFRAMGSPTTGAVTAVFPAAVSRCCWNIDEADGVNTGGTNGSAAVVQFVTNTGANLTTITGTLAAFADASNAAYGAFGVQASSGTTFTPGAGFTTQGVANGESFALCFTEAGGNDTSVDGSWSASGRSGVLAIEIAAAAGGVALSLTPAVETNTAQGIARQKLRTPTPATETDTATQLARTKRRALPPAAEAEAAVPIVRAKRRSITPAAETDIAVAVDVGGPTAIALTPAAEADIAVALSRVKRRTITPALEVDEAPTILLQPLRDLTLTIGPPGFDWTVTLDGYEWAGALSPYEWVAIADPFAWEAAALEAFGWDAVSSPFVWAAVTPEQFVWAAGPPFFD